MIAKYGRQFPAGWSAAQVELWGYANAHGPDVGGLGAAGHLKRAMMALWPGLYAGEAAPGVPRWREELESFVQAWCNHRIIVVIGHASAGKTHSFAHIATASYLADPLDSILTLTSTHLDGLRKRLWADTVSAVNSAHFGEGLRGRHLYEVRSHDMTIRRGKSREDKYVIEGISTDRGEDAVEKIQGNHSRRHRYVVIDEAQGTPPAIFDAAANLMADPDFRLVMLANPTRRYSTLGNWCEPKAGWGSLDAERDTQWETKKGGICLRLDGLRSANLRAGRTVFPYLLRTDYIEQVKQSFGENTPRYWTFIRGYFPPEGLTRVVYPANLLHRAEARIDYVNRPTPIAALDPAFEGGDQCVLAIGEFGAAGSARCALNVRAMIPLRLVATETSEPLDYLIAREVVRVCRERGVAPEHLILDTTGAGRGIAAILEKEWSRRIEKCCFGGTPSDRKLKAGESDVSSSLFDRFVSELWWAGRAWIEEGLVGNITDQFPNLRAQLSAREYETAREMRISIESKGTMKARMGCSPDEADAFVLLVELLRRKGAVAGTRSSNDGSAPEDPQQRRAIRYSRMLDTEQEFLHGAA